MSRSKGVAPTRPGRDRSLSLTRVAGNDRSIQLVTGVGLALVPVLVVLGVWVGLALGRPGARAATHSDPIQSTSRTVPTAVSHLTLLNDDGQPRDLAAFRGKVVILADFMTSCQEECPITTGALLDVQRSLAADHLLGKVSIVEVSVDPWRDVPSRLLAYRSMVGAHWELLSGSVANLHRFWSWFGVWYQRVPEGKPASIDWQTGEPYTFDIDHSDAVFVLGPDGNERALVTGNANVGKTLPRSLEKLLDQEGRRDLRQPGYASWTPAEMLAAVGSVLHEPVPDSTSD